MARKGSPWCALRPALLGGAAAIMWLTLSSTAASADAGPDSPSLTGSATSTVLSLPHSLTDSVSTPSAGSPAGGAVAPGPAQSVASRISGLADNAIAVVPALEQAVPPGTVSSISAPCVDVADAVTAVALPVVVAPAAEAVPVLEPVLQPVSDLLTGATPVSLPALPIGALPAGLPAVGSADPAVDQQSPAEAPAAALEESPDPGPASGALPSEFGVGDDLLLQSAGNAAPTDISGMEPASADPASGQSVPGDPAHVPGQVPGVPASGTGSSGSSAGPSGAAAWLSVFDIGLERPGALLASEPSGHIPAPASFDPGSSPD
ncbi:hypothetical protein ACFVVC_19905 [Pseudarthrobacter sp. NPDC058196]|uniref:hypothetical protein n=1 Tax=Pseudarthrobacter sp. NPDC058196 TaxID=3346376 RepID=UPI0036D7903A